MDDKKIVTEVKPAEVSQPEEKSEFEKQLAEKDAKIANLTDQVKNLNIGILKAKGKISEGDGKSSPDDLDELVEQKVAKALAETELAKAVSEKDDIIKRQAQENKELKVALASRAQVGNSDASGGSRAAETTGAKVPFWTPEQEIGFAQVQKNLASIGITKTIDQIKEDTQKNYLKIKQS